MPASRKTNTRRTTADKDWDTIHRFAVSLERGRFNDYIDLLQRPRKLFWTSFVSGVGKGFGAFIGATVVVAILAILLGWLGHYLPGQVGDFFQKTFRIGA